MNEEKIIANGKFVRFVSRNGWEYVTRSNASGVVAIVAVTNEGNLLLVEQLRPPFGKNVIELPAGLAGDIPEEAHEALASAAKRELLEETGYNAEEMIEHGVGAVSAGITNELITLFEAKGLKKIEAGGGDGSENITVHEIPLKQLHSWIEDRQAGGAIVDWKIFAGLYFLNPH